MFFYWMHSRMFWLPRFCCRYSDPKRVWSSSSSWGRVVGVVGVGQPRLEKFMKYWATNLEVGFDWY